MANDSDQVTETSKQAEFGESQNQNQPSQPAQRAVVHFQRPDKNAFLRGEKVAPAPTGLKPPNDFKQWLPTPQLSIASEERAALAKRMAELEAAQSFQAINAGSPDDAISFIDQALESGSDVSARTRETEHSMRVVSVERQGDTKWIHIVNPWNQDAERLSSSEFAARMSTVVAQKRQL